LDKKNKMKPWQKLLLVVFGLIVLGAVGIVAWMLATNPAPASPGLAIITPQPSPRTLYPTFIFSTELPTQDPHAPLPSTPTYSANVTLAVSLTPPANTPTLTITSAAATSMSPKTFTWEGSGSLRSLTFSLVKGDALINCVYRGTPGEAESYNLQLGNHNNKLKEMNITYDSKARLLNKYIREALARNDARGAQKWQHELSDLTAQNKKDVTTENAKWTELSKSIRSYFTVTLYRLSNSTNPWQVMTINGAGTKSATIRVESGVDYYLEVESSGPWSIQVEQ
jgi:hypothetical protein